MIKFVENKICDPGRIAQLLGECAAENMWANRGPLYWKLAPTVLTV